MHRLMMVALLMMAACGTRTPDPDQTYRDRGKEIYSNASFDAARLTGRWAQVADFAPVGAADCNSGGAEFSAGDSGLTVFTRLCLSGREAAFTGPIAFTAPGRMVLRGADPAGIGQAWWVIWVDTDYRTMVIGTPSGEFGFILNRDGNLPSDRLVAAKEILDWNGYDLQRLQVFRR